MTTEVIATNIVYVHHGKIAIIPNGNTMHLTHKCVFKSKGISDNAHIAHVLPGLKYSPLISLGNLCGDRCDMTLNNIFLKKYKKGQHLITGPCNRCTGMWDLDINIPKISPWHPTPIAGTHLVVEKLQDLCKVAIE